MGYSGIRIYSGIYSGYSAPGSRIAGMEIQVFQNKNSSQTSAYSRYSYYSYSGLVPNERALNMSTELSEMFNHKVRNINSVLLIYTDSGIYISQTFFGHGNFAFENSTAKQAVVYYW